MAAEVQQQQNIFHWKQTRHNILCSSFFYQKFIFCWAKKAYKRLEVFEFCFYRSEANYSAEISLLI
jgi:hypothetical protein